MVEGASQRRKAAVAFGWLGGGSLGILLNYGLTLTVNGSWDVGVGSFVLFIVGAFAGMALADRLGERGFRALGVAAGILLAAALGVVLSVSFGST